MRQRGYRLGKKRGHKDLLCLPFFLTRELSDISLYTIHRFSPILKQWERMVSHLLAHTALLHHKALLQLYISLLSLLKAL